MSARLSKACARGLADVVEESTIASEPGCSCEPQGWKAAAATSVDAVVALVSEVPSK